MSWELERINIYQFHERWDELTNRVKNYSDDIIFIHDFLSWSHTQAARALLKLIHYKNYSTIPKVIRLNLVG